MLAATAPPPPATCPFTSPCVIASVPLPFGRDPAPGTMVVFSGRGFAPRSPVGAEWGSFCSPAYDACDGVGRFTTFKANAKGRFTFRFRYGAKDPPGPRPKGSGGEEVRFSGRVAGGDAVTLYGAPVPPDSSPEAGEQAQGVARALDTLQDAVAANLRVSAKASDAQQAELDRCRPELERAEKGVRGAKRRRRHEVVYGVVDAAGDASTYGTDGPAFAAYADALDALALPPGPLADGAAAWTAAVRAPRYVPPVRFCQVIAAWRRTGYAPDAEPVAPDATGIADELWGDPRLRAGAAALRDLGVDREGQELFAGSILGLERYILI